MNPAGKRRVLAGFGLACIAACRSAAHDAAPALAEWTIAPAPVLQIGTAVIIGSAGDPHTEFSRIRGVVRMPAGVVVVADGDSRELRVFDPAGHFVRALSRMGSGPGEFRAISFIARERDTIIAYDGAASLVSRFTVDSGFISRARFGGSHGSPIGGYSVLGRLSDGTLLVRPRSFLAPPPSMTVVNTVTRRSVKLGILRQVADGRVTWLGPFLGASVFEYKEPKALRGIGGGVYVYGPRLLYAASGDHVWIGDSGNRGIVLYDASGAPADTAAWPDGPRELDADAMDRAKQRALAESPDRAEYLEVLYSASLRPPRAPYFSSFHTGAHGEMWVERFREDPATPAVFVVFDSTGTPRAAVTVPAGVDVRDVGDDYIAGILTDGDGVETVAEYRLQRTEPGSELP